ncbi:unnamed protein product [Sphagnum jensenii]|uniref:Triacylglycerol lipase n=1 Tax=Sphagnum jensenii TaxID=128206 RepID=A0ABP1A5I4_9BRYO
MYVEQFMQLTMLTSSGNVFAIRLKMRMMMIMIMMEAAVRGETFCKQVVQPLGYACVEYTVETDDGFVLVLHRLSHVKKLAGDNIMDSGVLANANLTRGENLGPSEGGNGFSGASDYPNTNVQAVDEQKMNSGANLGSNNTGCFSLKKKPISAHGRNHHRTSQNYTADPKGGKGAPVLLMHQEFLNGDSWFQFVDAKHVGRLLPVLLLDDGFDVWVGHQRATYWCHDHVSLHYTQQAFWDWTWDEHAHYDLPAQLRFINAETNQTVHYIGISQAGTAGAAGATYADTSLMIRSLTLIGPTAYRGNTNSLLLDAWAYFFGLTLDSEYYATGFQNGAFNYTNEFSTAPITADGVTGLEIGLISGPNCCLGTGTISLSNGWDGTTSFKNLLHWQQGIRQNTWAHFDYFPRTELNMMAYNQPTPPSYEPAQIPATIPVLIILGGQDWTAPPHGINMFMTQLQQVPHVVNLTKYAHYDLIFSATRENDVYLPILSFLESSLFT